jgi:hypothetical protein
MSLDAHALLRLTAFEMPPPTEVRSIGDAVLVRLPVGFASEPHELAASLRGLLGDRLASHVDPRGVFVLPGAALEHALRADGYDAAVALIGEAGMWVAPEASAPARSAALEALMARALDGEEIDPEAMQAAMRDGLAQVAAAFGDDGDDVEDDEDDEEDDDEAGASGPALDLRALLADPAMLALADKMRDRMRPHGEDDDDDEDDDDEDDGALDASAEAPGQEQDEDGGQTDLELPDLGALMRSPAFVEMMRSAQEVLAENPDEARKLAERFGLLGAPHPTKNDEDDEA